jgi:hypothetical protein
MSDGIVPMQTVPADFASLSAGTFVTNTGGAPPTGGGSGPSTGFANVSPLDALSQIQNPDSINPFDPTNFTTGLAADHTGSLSSGFPLPSAIGEVYENATNRLNIDNLSNQTENTTFVVANTVDLGEPPVGSPMFVLERTGKVVGNGRGRTKSTEMYSLQQVNYLLAKESTKSSGDMELEDAPEQALLSEFTFIGFLLSAQVVMSGTATAMVVAVSGTNADIPLLWSGHILGGDHLGFVAKYIDANAVSDRTYKFSETKKKAMPRGAHTVLQILPVNFERYTSKPILDVVSHTPSGDMYAGSQLSIGMSLKQVSKPNKNSKTAFYSIDYLYTRQALEVTFGVL